MTQKKPIQKADVDLTPNEVKFRSYMKIYHPDLLKQIEFKDKVD